ncbi:MAG: 3'-5' exonuclease [Candidatus Doudnabacteria bacterium]|nr:3'-5' exonuclease [Candidatus Doudnabacteria bacterium]
MDFKKDLLIVDLETTGLDAARHEIIQLGAVLLDRKILKEKEVFSSFIKPSKWKTRDKKSMAVNKIKFEQVKDAPGIKKVLRQFDKLFNPKNLILSYYGGPLDMDFLRVAYGQNKIKWKFDYHFFNLWGVFYTFLAARGQLKNGKKFAGFSLEDLMRRWKISPKNRHNALEDCRIEAEVLRQIVNSIK